MAPHRACVWKNINENVNKEALPQDPQAPTDPLAEQVSNAEFRVAFQVLSQATTTQADRKVVVPVNPKVGMTA